MLKLKCVETESENSLLVAGKIYTVDHVSSNGRVFVNVFENMEDEYDPMYGSYDYSMFDLASRRS